MVSVFSATKKLLRARMNVIRAHLREFPRPAPPSRRRQPTAQLLWVRYASAMLTSQQRNTVAFWDRLNRDGRWRAMLADGPSHCPSERALVEILRANAVRFPRQKAARLREGARRDFVGIAELARSVLREKHDAGIREPALRFAEIEVACAVQSELGGCGVAPKIARLILKLPGAPFEHLVPVDSRWRNALASVGADIAIGDLARECSYRLVEDEIARAAYALKVPPLFADAAVFGWIGPGADGEEA